MLLRYPGREHRSVEPIPDWLSKGAPLVKVIDFGLARGLHKHGKSPESFASNTPFVGTLEYIDPNLYIREYWMDE